MKTFVVTLLIVGVAVVVAVISHREKVISPPVPMVESSPEQTQPGKVVAPKQAEPPTVSENKNETTQINVGRAGLVFGMMGFIFGISALSQVSLLKKDIEKLKSQIDPKS